MTRILFVDDERRVLDGLRRLLRPRCKSWDLQFADSGEQALALLAAEPCDVVVTDMRMPSMDGAELLGLVQSRHPQVLRVVLSGYTELDAAVRAAPVAHQFLAKPCDAPELVATLERMLALRESTGAELIRSIGAIRVLPTTAAHHAELAALLSSHCASAEAVADLAERDVALAVQVLHMVSSAFFGNPDPQVTIRDGVAQLGLKVLRDLFGSGVLVTPAAPSLETRIERKNRHAVRVARLSRLMTDEVVTSGYLAGLVHDVGAWLDPGAEIDCDGDTAEVALRSSRGHALLALWGLPAPILEVARRSPSGERSPLAHAVAAADRLVCGYERGRPAPALEGVEAAWQARVPDWRERLDAEGGVTR